MRLSSILVISLHCIFGFVNPEEHDRERRDLSMLRMGKRGLEILPARSINLPPLVPPNYDTGEFEERELVIPDTDYEGRFVRVPPFPRIGKVFEEYLNEIRRDISDEELRQLLLKYQHNSRQKRSTDNNEAAELQEKKSDQKRAAPFPRLGTREENELSEEERDGLMDRAAPFPRLGLMDRAAPFPRLGLMDRAAPFPRLGLMDRAAPFPRLGQRDEERSTSFPKEGVRDYDDEYFQVQPFPRNGLQDSEYSQTGYNDVDKKAMGMLRMGRSGENTLQDQDEKRGMSMLRMGKRAMSMLRMGKRPMNMLRMGRSQPLETEEEKRAMSMLRMGKRGMGMLRMGRSDGSETEEEKRAMSMLRMGKRGMGMLRMGRSDNSEATKRAMGMLRMGRGMGMLRMGRSGNAAEQNDEKRAMSMLRMGKRPVSMLRMGKRDTETVDNISSDTKDDSISKPNES